MSSLARYMADLTGRWSLAAGTIICDEGFVCRVGRPLGLVVYAGYLELWPFTVQAVA